MPSCSRSSSPRVAVAAGVRQRAGRRKTRPLRDLGGRQPRGREGVGEFQAAGAQGRTLRAALAGFPSGVTPTDICGSTTTNGATGYTTVLGNDGYIYQSINTGNWTKLSNGGVTHITLFPGGGALYTLSSAC